MAARSCICIKHNKHCAKYMVSDKMVPVAIIGAPQISALGAFLCLSPGMNFRPD